MNMPRHPHRFFLDIDPAVASDATAPYAVLPIPYERTVSFGAGTANGPAAILDASHEVEDFDEELLRPLDLAVQTLPWPDIDGVDEERALETVCNAASSVLEARRFLLSLGGEHTVTFPLVGSALEVYPSLSVLHLDAHLDLRDSYEGTALSHACAMRRVRELGAQTVHVGMRSWSEAEHTYATRERLPVFSAAEIAAETGDRWIQRSMDGLSDCVYVTVDIDVLDPALAPGTGTPEPGGPSWQQVLRLLRRVFKEKQVVAADIVEVAPIPGTRVTEFVAARLGAKMLAYHRHESRVGDLSQIRDPDWGIVGRR